MSDDPQAGRAEGGWPRRLSPVGGPYPVEKIAGVVAGMGEAAPTTVGLLRRGRLSPDLMTQLTLYLLARQPRPPRDPAAAGGAGRMGAPGVAGKVWARERVTYHRPIEVDDAFTIEGRSTGTHVRKQRRYATTTSTTLDASGRRVASNVTTGLLSYRPDPSLARQPDPLRPRERPACRAAQADRGWLPCSGLRPRADPRALRSRGAALGRPRRHALEGAGRGRRDDHASGRRRVGRRGPRRARLRGPSRGRARRVCRARDDPEARVSRALEGVRVLDLADRSAALAGRVLADLGAEVILVEPAAGAPIRHLAPFLDDRPGPERSFQHLYFSANKRSVVLDPIADEDDFARLVASADLLLETARPGGRDAVDHARLTRWNPELVQISVTPFGLDDVSGRKANDLVAGAAGGLVGVSGQRRGVPVQGGAHPSYCLAGLAAASASLIALHRRDAARRAQGRAEGVHVDLSLQEATAAAVAQTANATFWRWHGRIPKRPGLSSALRCADGRHVGLLVRPIASPLSSRGSIASASNTG